MLSRWKVTILKMLDLGDSIRSFFIYLIRSAWPEKNLCLECSSSICNRRAEDGKNAIWESGLVSTIKTQLS